MRTGLIKPLVVLAIALAACGGADDTVEPPATTTAATTTTISAEPTAAEACYQASIAPEIVDYVDDGENQTPIPSGVVDLFYAVAVKCELYSQELLADGRREAAEPVSTLAKRAFSYSECLLDTGLYRCGMLRISYISDVLDLHECPKKSGYEVHSQKIRDCEYLASE
jgi:hypothetical protein